MSSLSLDLVWNKGYWISWATRSLLSDRLPRFIPIKIQFELAGNSYYRSTSYRSSIVNGIKHVLPSFLFPVACDFRSNNHLFVETVFCAHNISYQLWFRSKQDRWLPQKGRYDQYLAVPRRFSGRLSSPQGVDDNPTILVCSRCMSQRYDCFYTDSALLYHSGWLRLVHFDHTTIIMQGGDVPSAVRWCTITLQSCFITVGIYAFMISILLSLSMLLGWRLMCISFFTLWAGRKSLDH